MSSSSGPRRSARLAHRSIDSKSSVRCGYTDRNAHSLLLKEMAGVDGIPNKRRNTKGSLPFLPEEVVYNILVFVPAEILYNVMRYVCQAWCNVINNPEFINAHLQRSTSGILIQHWDEDHPEVIHFVEINNCDVWTRELRYGFSRPICASCDGLVLFPHDSNDDLFRVGNPITKQILTLPPLVGPIFHDTRSALVYVHSIRRYKVVIVYRINSLEFKCAILTVGAETAWRLIDANHIPCANVYLFESSPLSAGEYLYWTPNSRACSYLLALDVEAEIMHQLPDPKIFKEKGGYFLATENFLALMVRRKEFLWEVWVLTELHTGEWTRLYNIDLTGEGDMLNQMLHPQICSLRRYLYPFVWLKNGDLVIFQVTDPSRTYIVYNIKTAEVTSFAMGKDARDIIYRNNIYCAHVNSLVSLKVG